MNNKITLPELMPPSGNDVEMREISVRKKKQTVSAKIVFIALFCIGILALAALAIDKLASGAAEDFLKNKFSSLFAGDPSFGSISSALTPSTSGEPHDSSSPIDTSAPEDSLPVILPVESTPEADQSTPESDSEASPEETKKEPQTDSQQSETTQAPEIPSDAIHIINAASPQTAAKIENLCARSFNLEYLAAMSSAVIPNNSKSPLVLVVQTHTSESYLPSGTAWYSPSGGELARSEDPTENMIAVGKAFCASLEAAGVKTVHITVSCDSDGNGKSYINSRNLIAETLAKYPTIKYVIDLHREVITNAEGNLIRETANVGNKILAPVRLTVSGGATLDPSTVNANLSLALQLNGLISDFDESLARPVRIADAVYTDGLSPRNLKIDIGSCAQTLEEATTTASLLGELFALLIIS